MKSSKLILKTQQRFKSKNHDVFTEEVNKIALSLNDDKRIQSIDSIETYACGTNKDLMSEREESKCNNIIKLYKQRLILMIIQMKIKQNIIQSFHIFQIIHTEY